MTTQNTEPLFDCPRCGRKNFTARGLKAHVCKGAPAPERAAAGGALALAAIPEWRVAGGEALEGLKRAAIDQMAAIAQMENRAAMGGTLAGLTLLRVKASLPHGEFTRWLNTIRADSKTNRSSFLKATIRQAQYYMKLAAVFLEKAKVTKPALLALPGDQLALGEISAEGDTRELFLKLQKFTGNCSLNELLIKHDIKAVGLKKELAAQRKKEADEAGEEEPARSAQDLCNEILEHLALARKGALEHAAWMAMSRAQHEDIKAAFATAADEVGGQFIKTHGRAAARRV
jgi:hypothetical protein